MLGHHAAMANRFRFPIAVIAPLALTLGARTAAASDSVPPPPPADPTFGSRTDKPDDSAALTFGRRLPTEWESRIGTAFPLDLSGPGNPPVGTNAVFNANSETICPTFVTVPPQSHAESVHW
jgi:hypothetical protein